MLGRLNSPVIMTLCVFILFPNLDRERSRVLQFEFLESHVGHDRSGFCPNALTVST